MAASDSLVADLQPRQRSNLSWALSDCWIMTWRSVKHISRSMDQLLSAVMFPVMFMLLNRYVFGGAINTGIEYVNYLFAGVLIQMLAFGANTTTINIAVDMKTGIIDRFRSLPMYSGALLVGHVLTDLVRNLISLVILLGVAYLIGFRPEASIGEWTLVIGLATLFSLAISWLSAILGLLVKSVEASQWVGFVGIFPLTFISSAFVPTDTMPPALQAFAENQPLTHVMNAMRSWLVGTPMGNSDWLSVIWCVGIIAISIPVAARMFRHHIPK
jgi:ABC-2 type transport system permease protein